MTEVSAPAIPDRLDILYIGPLPPHPGGAGILCGELMLGLARMGHRIRALAPTTKDAACQPDVFAAVHPNIAVRRFMARLHLTTPDFVHAGFREHLQFERAQVWEHLPTLLGTGAPDLVMLGREPCLWYFQDLRRELGVPALLIAHGLISYRSTTGQYPESLCREVFQRLRQPAWIVTPAMHRAQGLRSAGLGRVSVIPNPVDMELFAPRPRDPTVLRALSVPPEDVVVAHASNLKAVKRPLDIVASAKAVLGQNHALTYVVVGDGDHRAEMEQACRQWGIQDRFRFAGWVEHERMAAFLNLADIVVMPSETETQALVYLETQACGRTLLASDIPAAREVVQHGQTGLLFRLGDVNHLTEMTLAAAGSPQLRQEIGQRARRSVQAHAREQVLAAYDELVREVVARHRQEGGGRE